MVLLACGRCYSISLQKMPLSSRRCHTFQQKMSHISPQKMSPISGRRCTYFTAEDVIPFQPKTHTFSTAEDVIHFQQEMLPSCTEEDVPFTAEDVTTLLAQQKMFSPLMGLRVAGSLVTGHKLTSYIQDTRTT